MARTKIRKSGRRSRGAGGVRLPAALWKVPGFLLLLAGAGVGLVALDKYLRAAAEASRESISVEFVGDVPVWVPDELKQRISVTVASAGVDLRSQENAAAMVHQVIDGHVPWLSAVKVRTTNEGVEVEGVWRRPLAVVRWGANKYYVDGDLVVLEYFEIERLPLVTITGLAVSGRAPTPGDVWAEEDLVAAMELLVRLGRMDEALTAEDPLLSEIDRIDVANFDGRRSEREAHIVLYTKDNTQVMWGAEVGAWQRHLEATDEEKLAKLYAFYEENGTLEGVKYIDLRDPQGNVYLPVDQY